MKRSLISLLVCLPFAVSALSPSTLDDRISVTCPGKGKDGQCFEYATKLSHRLSEHGIHGRLIFYRWHIRNTAISGSHVLVSYDLADGSRFAVDNEIPHPKAVDSQATPEELVYLLGGDAKAPVDVELQDGLNRLSFF